MEQSLILHKYHKNSFLRLVKLLLYPQCSARKTDFFKKQKIVLDFSHVMLFRTRILNFCISAHSVPLILFLKEFVKMKGMAKPFFLL
jgi:hypothetical protein